MHFVWNADSRSNYYGTFNSVMENLNRIQIYFRIFLQSSPAISSSEGTRQKVQECAIFEVVRLQESEIIPGENLR